MSQFETLNLEIDGRIAWVTFDHPPVNLLDMQMIRANLLRGTIDAQERMASFMSLGAQTREGELDLDSVIQRL